jgi:hypothetical protein
MGVRSWSFVRGGPSFVGGGGSSSSARARGRWSWWAFVADGGRWVVVVRERGAVVCGWGVVVVRASSRVVDVVGARCALWFVVRG